VVTNRGTLQPKVDPPFLVGKGIVFIAEWCQIDTPITSIAVEMFRSLASRFQEVHDYFFGQSCLLTPFRCWNR
jgi:hypothetical protein